MKIKAEHFEYLKEEINKTGLNCKAMKNDYLDKGLSEKRFRWDLLYAAKLSQWIGENLYPYLNDEHIDTALKKISI